MIQISFQPAFDPYHAMFRILRLRAIVLDDDRVYSVDLFRIVDFYLLFPFLLSEIRLRPQDRKIKKIAEIYSNSRPYGRKPGSWIIFERMNEMQRAALNTLVSHDYFHKERFVTNELRITHRSMPVRLLNLVRESNEKDAALMNALRTIMNDYPLLGQDGLKARTQLMEFRYDAV